MKKFLNKYKKIIPVITGVMLFLCAGLSASSILPSMKNESHKEPEQADAATSETYLLTTENNIRETQTQIQEPEIFWYVYVTGAVNNPGVYKLPENSRVFHAIEAAGGFNSLAAQSDMNLAETLRDAEHIHILTKNEVNRRNSPPPTPAPGVYVKNVQDNNENNENHQERLIASKNNFFMMSTNQTPQNVKSNKNTKSSKKNSSGNNKNNKNANLEKVDINRASIQELEKLKGIGPALAKRIYEYRQTHGSFKSVEELVNVKGIGTAKLKNMREQIIIR